MSRHQAIQSDGCRVEGNGDALATKQGSPLVDMCLRNDRITSPDTSRASELLPAVTITNIQDYIRSAHKEARSDESLRSSDANQKRGSDSGSDSGEETIAGVGKNKVKVHTGPEGVRVQRPDGSAEITAPDGSVTIRHPVEVRNKDGSVTITYPYDGRRETTGFGNEDAREKETKYPDGRTETEYKDGHTKTTFPKGDERESETVSADGTKTTTKYRDGHTVTEDGKTGDKTVSYPPKGGKAGYTVVIHQDGTTSTGPYQEPDESESPSLK